MTCNSPADGTTGTIAPLHFAKTALGLITLCCVLILVTSAAALFQGTSLFRDVTGALAITSLLLAVLLIAIGAHCGRVGE